MTVALPPVSRFRAEMVPMPPQPIRRMFFFVSVILGRICGMWKELVKAKKEVKRGILEAVSQWNTKAQCFSDELVRPPISD